MNKVKLKLGATIVACALTGGLTFLACKKENKNVERTNNTNNTSQQPTVAHREVGTFEYQYYDKNLTSIDPADIDDTLPDYVLLVKTDSTAAGFDSIVKVIYFESENDAYAFAVANAEYAEMKTKIETARLIRNFADAHGVNENTPDDQVPQEVLEYVAEFTLYGKGTKATSGAGLLREYVSCPSGVYGGACFVSGLPQWTLGGFNNKASGAHGLGLSNFCWDGKWFKNSWIFLFFGTGVPIPFGCAFFDNRAESCL